MARISSSVKNIHEWPDQWKVSDTCQSRHCIHLSYSTRNVLIVWNSSLDSRAWAFSVTIAMLGWWSLHSCRAVNEISRYFCFILFADSPPPVGILVLKVKNLWTVWVSKDPCPETARQCQRLTLRTSILITGGLSHQCGSILQNYVDSSSVLCWGMISKLSLW